MKPDGYVVYEGPSRINGDPIVAIVTGLGRPSKNRKTGPMAHVWIMAQGKPPTVAAKEGLDESVCGDCAFRPLLTTYNKGGANVAPCYVTLIHGPQAIWHKWQSGGYPPLPRRHRFDLPVRVGAYGDPGALPQRLVRVLAGRCRAGWTAYTHQWKRFPGLAPFCMASVNNGKEQRDAIEKGFRTFRVIQKTDSVPWPIGLRRSSYQAPDREILCPASPHDRFATGERTTCARCRLCDGTRYTPDRRANIAVYAH